LIRATPYNLYLSGSLSAGGKFPLSLDDIQLKKGLCASDPDPNFHCSDGTTVPMEKVCNMKSDCHDGSDELECGDCTFEAGECGWQSRGDTDCYWYRQDGSQPCEELDCGGGDHTFQQDNQTSGYFMFLQHQNLAPNGGATFAGPDINSVYSSCMFKFWYKAYDQWEPTEDTHIDVIMNHKEEQVRVCRITKRSDIWKEATCYVGRRSDLFTLQLVSQPNSITDLIAVDDFSLEGCTFPRPAPDGCGDDRFTCANGERESINFYPRNSIRRCLCWPDHCV
jgi:hypothetical protein